MPKQLSDAAKITLVFQSLPELGYHCYEDCACCSGCASVAICNDIKTKGIPMEGAKWIYYHAQSAQAFHKIMDKGRRTRNLYHPLRLGWGGDANKIIGYFQAVGLRTRWGGSDNLVIWVYPTTWSESQIDAHASHASRG